MRRSFVVLALALMLPLPALAGQVTVKPGETLSEIAERHGISLSRLMQLNGIREADMVQVGQVLTLPGGGGSRSGATAAGTITVQPGETLSEIAERHGIGLSQLMQINGIRNANAVEAGQTLRLREARQAPAASTTAAAPSYPRGASSHLVRSGESLSQIASGYGVSLSKLIALNGIEDPDHVESGTRLKLKGQPPARPSSTATGSPAVTTATAPAAGGAQRTGAATGSSGTGRPAATAAIATATPATTAAIPNGSSRTTPIAAATAVAAGSAPAAGTGGASMAGGSRTAGGSPTLARASGTPQGSAGAAANATATAMARPDWRTYGPLQINWAGWQAMGGSMVAPTLNAQGQSLYVAVNCGARKLNATTAAGQWQAWGDPDTDYERQLVGDYCRSGG